MEYIYIYRNLHFDSSKKHPCEKQFFNYTVVYFSYCFSSNFWPLKIGARHRSFGGSNHPSNSSTTRGGHEVQEVRCLLPQGIDLVVSQQVEVSSVMIAWLGGGNSNIFGIFTPNLGEMIQFNEYFSDGLKPPTRWCTWSWFFGCEFFFGQKLDVHCCITRYYSLSVLL